ncbi:MAG: ATP-binding domain-containing protein [Candidatus Thiodiazotropha endolucinida]
MKDPQQHIKNVSRESLEIFDAIAAKASQRLKEAQVSSAEVLASVNTMTDAGAVQKLGSISASNREAYQALTAEPAISRLVAADETGKTSTYYISRKFTVSLEGDLRLASYQSPIGRLAALPIGEKVTLHIGGVDRCFELLEQARYKPIKVEDAWDSKFTVFEGDEYGLLTVESLLALLRERGVQDAEAALEALLQGDAEVRIREGLQHEVRAAMALRDQPVLDRFQDEIFRLPLNNQLLIIGPPGTGKTTTLIRRLSQKVAPEFLESEEKMLVAKIESETLPHQQSWLMFTPTELLKHFVKEAFNREQVPASDRLIKTWETHRNDFARRVLGILQSATTTGKFILKAHSSFLRRDVEEDPIGWFESFQDFHQSRVLSQLRDGVGILDSLRNESNDPLIDQINEVMPAADSANLMSVYRALDRLQEGLIPFVRSLKEESDSVIHKCLVRTFNADRDFLNSLAKLIDTILMDEEPDTGDEFDDDGSDEIPGQATSLQKAEKVYKQTLRSLARYNYLKRSLPKGSRAQKIRDWLGDRIPEDRVLLAIGESIATQNGFRRFVDPFKRYVADVPASYREFRKLALKDDDWYIPNLENHRYIGSMELDAIVLLMLRAARELMAQSFVAKQQEHPRFLLLRTIAEQFRNQVLVDEATDFSPIQLACMESLTHPETRSFFACGDFNQRITSWGTRSASQIQWVANTINTRTINIVYRQSQKLNEFSGELLRVLGGNMESRGLLPENMNHTGVPPVLLEHCNTVDDIAIWLAERVREVERIVDIGQMPTVAVLVNSEDEVKPMAEALNELLEDVNLRAVACSDGQSLGEGSDVRVFDTRHIKGLEFEAVFFVGVDALEEKLQDLFGKYLYVGATRAATYFGITCGGSLPDSLQPLKKQFVEAWN